MEGRHGRSGYVRQHPLEDLRPRHEPTNNWTVDSIRRWVLTSIETFGVDRCIFATNWPVDWLWSTYDNQVGAYTEIISDFSRDERVALFSKNAEKLYRI